MYRHMRWPECNHFFIQCFSQNSFTMKINYPKLFNNKFLACLLLSFCHSFYNPVESGAVEIPHSNFDAILAANEVVFVLFYAEWCYYSNKLMPIFNEAADEVMKAGHGPGKVLIGKVSDNPDVVTRFHLTKYPTVKLFLNGLPYRREYRGRRSVQALVEYINKQLTDPIVIFESLEQLNNLNDKQRHIIAYMKSKNVPEYEVLRRVALNLKDDCSFHAGFADTLQLENTPDRPVMVFRPDKKTSVDADETYQGQMSSFDEVHKWALEKCTPLVREITFENAEELIEEKLPFMLLFHEPNDTDSVKKFKEVVHRELEPDRQYVNFLTADSVRFKHPLKNLGKTINDLPLIAIDTFKHMFLFPNYNEMETPGVLKQFLLDLYSEKLHREFHYGPDPVKKVNANTKPTNPPNSTFKKLAPSENRYTLIRDEL